MTPTHRPLFPEGRCAEIESPSVRYRTNTTTEVATSTYACVTLLEDLGRIVTGALQPPCAQMTLQSGGHMRHPRSKVARCRRPISLAAFDRRSSRVPRQESRHVTGEAVKLSPHEPVALAGLFPQACFVKNAYSSATVSNQTSRL